MLGIIKSAGNGDKAIGIEKVMTALAIIGTIMLLITFLTTKERIIPKPEQKSSVKRRFKRFNQKQTVGNYAFADDFGFCDFGNERRFVCILF